MAIFAFMVMLSEMCWSADAFNVTAVAGTQTGTIGFKTAQQAFDSLRQANLSAIVPTYNGSGVVNVAIDFRGLPLGAGYRDSDNPSWLELNIPSLGISRTFKGATREESRILFRDFFKNGDVLGRIMKELAKTSPVDPVAGNPNSLQSRMVAQTFEWNLRSLVSEFATRTSGGGKAAVEPPRWLVAAAGDITGLDIGNGGIQRPWGAGVGLDVTGYRQAALRSAAATIPFSYSLSTQNDRSISVNGSIQYTDTQGANTYGLNLGAMYQLKVSDRWHITPSGSLGITASGDLGSLATMVLASLNSAALIYQNADSGILMSNAINYSRTLKSSIGGYTYDSKLENVTFVNGLMLSTPLTTAGRNFSIEYSLTDTRYIGSALYNQRSDAVGVAILRSTGKSGYESYTRVGLSYLNGTRSNGVNLSVQLVF
jgi:hypothetical protein